MKVIEHIDKATGPLFSFEIIPPLRGRNVSDITDIVKKLLPFNPSWIDVTSHSAGAFYHEKIDGTLEKRVYKRRPGSIGICGIIQNRFKVDTVAHVLCRGFTKEETEDALIELNYLGVENILALRGDAPNYDKKVAPGRSTNNYSSDLIDQVSHLRHGKFLEEIDGANALDFCVGVAGYPEKHFEAPNLARDIYFLKEKVQAGGDYIVTQMFFDNKKFFSFVDECRKEEINAPIIPGIKIIKNVKQLSTLPKNFYIDFPDDLVNELTENPQHGKEIGIRWAIKQAMELLEHKVPCVHFYVMNDSESVSEVIKKCQKL